MKIAKTRKELREAVYGSEVGFVPTMGALHQGHLSLVQASKDKGLFTVVSIFVNPAQFNEAKDFETYPIQHDQDIEKLGSVGCDLVFIPSVKEVYPEGMHMDKYKHDFGPIAKEYEGRFRPGHFEGVGRVVHTLFEIVEPTVAFFGEKDFQQLAVVNRLVELANMQIEIVGVPTMREANGLAMSSRNQRLTDAQKEKAAMIYEMLLWARSNYGTLSVQDILTNVKQHFMNDSEWDLEYFDIIDAKSFQPIRFDTSSSVRGVVAAKLGGVRLIDNMAMNR